MRLLSLNKYIGLLIFFLILPDFLYSEEEAVDIWKKTKKNDISSTKTEGLDNNKKTLYDKIDQNQINQKPNIQEEQFEKYEEVKLYGIFDPDENNFSLNMWSRTKPDEFKNTINRIRKLELSKTSEDIFIKTLFSNSYLPKNFSNKDFVDIKINWIIENNKVELAEKFLEKNNDFHNRKKLIQFLVDRNIANAKLSEGCQKVSFIKKDIKDPYLEKFKIYCLVFNNKKSEAQLLYDILKEQKQSDKFFDNKISFLLGITEKNDGKIRDDNLLNFYISSVTVENFNYEPKKQTKKIIWEYLNAANLIKLEDVENKGRIIEFELAANENRLEKEKIFEIYKRISFNLNTLIDAENLYKTFESVDSRALIYQKFLLSDNSENKLELLFLLKDLFKKDNLSNLYKKFLSDRLKEFDENDIPKKYVEIVSKNIVTDIESKLGKIKFDDKILHRSKVLKYFIEPNYSKNKAQKDLDSVYKKIKKNKKYFFSAKDVALLETLDFEGFKTPKEIDYKELSKKYSAPNNLQELVKNQETGFLSLKIVEIIGEDEVYNLDPETIYFIINLLNNLGLKNIRNNIIISSLPLRS